MKVVIFDFDNTLEEWLPYEDEVEAHLAREIAEKYGLDAVRFKQEFDRIKIDYLQTRSLPQDYGRDVWFSETFAHFEMYDVDVAPIIEHYWKLLVELVQVFPGTIEVLQELRNKGFRLALLSDGDGVVRQYKDWRIRKLQLEEYFEVILTSDEIGVNKPNPRLFLEVARRLGVSVHECIMIGDNPPKDLITAKELGIVTVWQRQGVLGQQKEESFSYVDYVIDDIKEVVELVTQTIAQK